MEDGTACKQNSINLEYLMGRLCLKLAAGAIGLYFAVVSPAAVAASQSGNSFIDQLVDFANTHTPQETRSYFHRYSNGMIGQLINYARQVQMRIETLNYDLAKGLKDDLQKTRPELLNALVNFHRLEDLMKRANLKPEAVASFGISTRVNEDGSRGVWDSEFTVKIGSEESKTEKLDDAAFHILEEMKVLNLSSRSPSSANIERFDLKPLDRG